MKTRQLIISASIVLVASIVRADPSDRDIFTDFEEFNPNTEVGSSFMVGDATFSGPGQFAGTFGEPELYFSGFRAWMVQGESVGMVSFGSGASLVEFWAIADPEATADSTITAFDLDGNVIGSPQPLVVGDSFKLFSFTGDIGFLEFDNSLAENLPTGMISIDDFGYDPIPAPATSALLLVGSMGLASRRRR